MPSLSCAPATTDASLPDPLADFQTDLQITQF
jgi:hypothetical protein